jgi:uncharacterized damage-inducible protein DinB
MKETARIKKLFEDLYEGDPWIGVNLMDTLKNLSPEQASKKISPQWNSIWEIVNHITSWRQNVLLRVQGKLIESPADNYFSAITDTSETAWIDTLQRLKDTQHQWTAFVENFNEDDFENIYQPNGGSYYEHIHGIIQHDAYHLGQVVLLAKAV